MNQLARDRLNVNHRYSHHYYLNQCDGFRQFNNSKGKVLGKRLKKIFNLIHVQPGMRILDVGCGRGELVLHCARNQAYAWGLDTSTAAISICNQARSHWQKDCKDMQTYAHFQQADAISLPFQDQFFDCVLLVDFIEHVYPGPLHRILGELRRCLKNGGKLIVHTSPNKYYLPIMGRFFALLSRIFHYLPIGGCITQPVLPWNIRTLLPSGLQRHIHVNEHSSFGLRRLFRDHGFKGEQIWFDLNPHYIDFCFTDPRAFRVLNRLRGLLPVKHLFYADLFGVASG
jgi:ubiquinone/menaquinone biosynthesis C-methylase UbiE